VLLQAFVSVRLSSDVRQQLRTERTVGSVVRRPELLLGIGIVVLNGPLPIDLGVQTSHVAHRFCGHRQQLCTQRSIIFSKLIASIFHSDCVTSKKNVNINLHKFQQQSKHYCTYLGGLPVK
jgi:hypothetical protein